MGFQRKKILVIVNSWSLHDKRNSHIEMIYVAAGDGPALIACFVHIDRMQAYYSYLTKKSFELWIREIYSVTGGVVESVHIEC